MVSAPDLLLGAPDAKQRDALYGLIALDRAPTHAASGLHFTNDWAST